MAAKEWTEYNKWTKYNKTTEHKMFLFRNYLLWTELQGN